MSSSSKSVLYYFVVITFFSPIGYFLSNRYTGWAEVEQNHVFAFILLFFIAVTVVYWSYIKEKYVINPYSCYSIFIFFWGFSFLQINSKQVSLDYYSIYLLVLSILFFFIGVFLVDRIQAINFTLRVSKTNRKRIFFFAFFLSVITFLLEVISFGYVPLFRMFVVDIYNETNTKLFPLLHYFVMMSAIFPTWAFLLKKQQMITNKQYNIILLISMFILFNFLSRQLLLMFFFCFLFAYLYYNAISLLKMSLILLLPLIMFLSLGYIRLLTGIGDHTSQLDYLQDYAGTRHEANLLETYGALYASNNFTTFKEFVDKSSEEVYNGYGVYTFRPLITLSLVDKFGFAKINESYNSAKALATYAIEPYLDFSLFGVVICNIFYGFLSGYYYRLYKRKKQTAIVPWSILVFCIIMTPFTNYFNMFFVWLILFLNIAIIPNYNEN